MKTFKERQVGDGQETPGKEGDGKPNGDIHSETQYVLFENKVW